MNNSIENLYKKGSNESSTASLDNLILNAAKQSCEENTSTEGSRKWLYLLSTAAVLVMGISVVFNLQNQNSEMKVSPESLDFSIIKEDLRTKIVTAPPLEPHPRPQKKRKPITPEKVNQAGLLGKIASQKPTIQLEQDSDTPQIENKPQIIFEKNLLEESKVKAIESEETSAGFSQNSDNVMVTGMRRAAKVLPDLNKENNLSPEPIEINKLEQLFKANNFKQAQELLEKLKRKYPSYDFTRYNN